MSKIDFTFKILMLGSAATGKSSLAERYITGVFNPDIKLTVGVDFYVKTVEVNGLLIKLQIWDLGGEQRFRFLLPNYSLGSSGGIFLYDITRFDTIESLNEWISIVKEKNGDIPLLLIGNKIDLANQRKIPKDYGKKIATMNKMTEFYEVSAKEGTNVEDVFQRITELMLQRIS